jgi:branched-subunit amino acid permease
LTWVALSVIIFILMWRNIQMGEFLIGFAVFGACLYLLAGYVALVEEYFDGR